MPHFFADDGEKIHYAESGSGRPPIVMLHGWTSSHQEWFPFIPALSAHHQVWRWDARGHGGHALTRPAAPTVTRMARDLHNLLEQADLEQVVAVGHSMGALTLWQYLKDYGCERIGKLCLIDQSPKLVTGPDWPYGIYGDFDATRSARFIEDLRQDFPESVLRLGALGLNQRARQKYEENAKGWAKARSFLETLQPGPLIQCWQSLTEADYREVLERIPVPALLIFGGQSNFYRADTAHFVTEKIPNAQLHIYEGTDHSPHQWQRERFVADLLAFIQA